MTWLAEICMLSFGIRRVVILVLAGALAGLSVPPLFILLALFIGLPILVWCLDGAERPARLRSYFFGAAFRIGFWFGFGYFLVAIHWIGAAFYVDGGWLLIAMPFAIVLLAAVLALFWGFATALAHVFWSHGAQRVVVLSAALTLGEFARGHLFTGFPFALPGYALTANDEMMQLASVIGVYGLTLLVFLLGTLPALIWPADNRGLTRRLIPFFTIVIVLGGQFAFGQYRLGAIPVVERQDIKLRLVQPAIAQSVKWQSESREFVMDRLLTLSDTRLGPLDAGLNGVTYLVWPESAMPFYLAEQPEELARIARMLPLGKFLITGAPRLETSFDGKEAAYNSVLVIDSNGEIAGLYDKTHLVPVGEYLPFSDLLQKLGLTQFVPGAEGWTAGDARRLISVAGGPAFLPLICYEIIFSGDLGDQVSEADFMLNLTNDGWFDGSIGIDQHFHHARLRAVEEGRSLVRVANTGITALVDPLGHVRASISAGSVGVVDVSPPHPIRATIFARWRHWPLLVALLGIFVVAFVQHRRRDKGLSDPLSS